MKKIYVDSNVFISYWDREYGRNISDFLEYYSAEVFRRTISCEFKLVISELTLREIRRILRLDEETLYASLNEYRELGKLEILKISKYTWAKAEEIAKRGESHVTDIAHALVAKEADALLVTWNLRDFKRLGIAVTSPKYL